MRDKFILIKGDSLCRKGGPQILHIGFQLLVSLDARPQDIAEISFLRQADPELRKMDFPDHVLHFPGVIIFSDKSQRHMQVLRRNIVSLHTLFLQIMHAGDQRLFHLVG